MKDQASGAAPTPGVASEALGLIPEAPAPGTAALGPVPLLARLKEQLPCRGLSHKRVTSLRHSDQGLRTCRPRAAPALGCCTCLGCGATGHSPPVGAAFHCPSPRCPREQCTCRAGPGRSVMASCPGVAACGTGDTHTPTPLDLGHCCCARPSPHGAGLGGPQGSGHCRKGPKAIRQSQDRNGDPPQPTPPRKLPVAPTPAGCGLDVVEGKDFPGTLGCTPPPL